MCMSMAWSLVDPPTLKHWPSVHKTCSEGHAGQQQGSGQMNHCYHTKPSHVLWHYRLEPLHGMMWDMSGSHQSDSQSLLL